MVALDVFKEVLQLLIGSSARRGDLAACRWHRVLSMMPHLGHRPDAGNRYPQAIGASDSAVLVQFALEAIVVAGLGGLIGVAVGIGSVMTVSMAIPLLGPTGFLSTFSPTLGVSPVVVSFAVSLAHRTGSRRLPRLAAAQLNRSKPFVTNNVSLGAARYQSGDPAADVAHTARGMPTQRLEPLCRATGGCVGGQV